MGFAIRFKKSPHTHFQQASTFCSFKCCRRRYFYDSRRCVSRHVNDTRRASVLSFSLEAFFIVFMVWYVRLEFEAIATERERVRERMTEGVKLIFSKDKTPAFFGCEREQRLSINISIYVFGSSFVRSFFSLLFLSPLYFAGFSPKQMTNI